MNHSSSSSSEKVTIAYTESVLSTEEETRESFDSVSTASSSLETPTSQQSVSTVLGALADFRETEEFFGYSPITNDPGPKMNALQYFWNNSIFQLYTFMMTHLLAHTPEDPVEFLTSLLERCINYRDGKGEQPPLVFEDSHIASVYTALDPLDDGSITYKQYINGMMTLGLTEINVWPNELDSRQRDVPKDVFLQEAKRALIAQLDWWLGSPSSKTTFKSEEDGDKSNVTNGTNENSQSIDSQLVVREDEFSVPGENFSAEESQLHSITNYGSEVVTTSFEIASDPSKSGKPISFIKTPQSSQNKSSTYIIKSTNSASKDS